MSTYADNLIDLSDKSTKIEEIQKMNKISNEFINAQAALYQEAIHKKPRDIDEIVRLTKNTLAVAKGYEKNGLLLTLTNHMLFHWASNETLLENLNKLPEFSDFDEYPDTDEEWEEDQGENGFKEFINLDKDETAIEAIQRFYHFTTVLQSKSYDGYQNHQMIFFSPPVEINEIKAFEETNEITLPKAYVNFIRKMGFISFGTSLDSRSCTLAEMNKKKIDSFDLNVPWSLSESDEFHGYKVTDFNNGFRVFFEPQHGELAFLLKNHKNKQGELLFIMGNRNGFREYENFDIFVQSMVNSRIEESLNSY